MKCSASVLGCTNGVGKAAEDMKEKVEDMKEKVLCKIRRICLNT